MNSLRNRFDVPVPLPSTPTPSPHRRFFSSLAQRSLIALALLVGSESAFAQTVTLLYSFAGGTSDGGYPYSGLMKDSSGNLYGTTTGNGSHGGGTVYKLAPSGSSWTESVLYNFGGTGDGDNPQSGVIMDSSGNLYGTTLIGGLSHNIGTFFKLSPGTPWTEPAQFIFPGGNAGQNPYNYGNLIQDSSGNFYGTLYTAGVHSQGAVFEMSVSGTTTVETVIFDFQNVVGSTYGEYPFAALIMDSSGNLYGTTTQGGSHGVGVVFELTPPSSGNIWTETVLWNFGGTGDGSTPYGALLFDSSGNLYGTTTAGGAHNDGTVFELSPSGSSWTESRLYSFGGTGDGNQPWSNLVMDSSGNLWGTTKYGGAHSEGTVFKLSPTVGTWTEAELYSFKGGTTDGSYPIGGLIIDSSGNLYGTTWEAGAHGYGAVFKLVP